MIFSFLNTKEAFLYLPPDYYMTYGLFFGYFLHTFLIRSTLSSNSPFRISSKTVLWVTCIFKHEKKSIQVCYYFHQSDFISFYICFGRCWNIMGIQKFPVLGELPLKKGDLCNTLIGHIDKVMWIRQASSEDTKILATTSSVRCYEKRCNSSDPQFSHLENWEIITPQF